MKKSLLTLAIMAALSAVYAEDVKVDASATVTEPEVVKSVAEVRPIEPSGPVIPLDPATIPTQPMQAQFASNGTRAGDGLIINYDNKGKLESVIVVHTGPYNGDEYTSVLAAGMQAKAKLASFIKNDLQTKRTLNIIAQNIERSVDKAKTRPNTHALGVTDAQVEGTEAPVAEKTLAQADNDNVAVRNFAVATTRVVTETISQNAAAILRGVAVTGQRIDISGKAVTVQITWSRKNLDAAKELGAAMGNI